VEKTLKQLSTSFESTEENVDAIATEIIGLRDEERKLRDRINETAQELEKVGKLANNPPTESADCFKDELVGSMFAAHLFQDQISRDLRELQQRRYNTEHEIADHNDRLREMKNRRSRLENEYVKNARCCVT
jgi:hypothetical protein